LIQCHLKTCYELLDLIPNTRLETTYYACNNPKIINNMQRQANFQMLIAYKVLGVGR
jgi:hypothetical protein